MVRLKEYEPLITASAITIKLISQSLDNSARQLISQLNLTLTQGDLDNSAQGTLASQKDLVIKLLAGDVNNQQDDLIFSQKGRLDLVARTFNNQQGTLQSQTDNQLRLSGALNNQGGRVDSFGGNLDLMDNAISYKDSLNLQLGVSLTAEQVAALMLTIARE